MPRDQCRLLALKIQAARSIDIKSFPSRDSWKGHIGATAGMYITEFNSLIWESWLLIINGISTYEKDNVIKNDINICPAVAKSIVIRSWHWRVSSVLHERCNDFLTVASLISVILSHPWIRGTILPDGKTLCTFISP